MTRTTINHGWIGLRLWLYSRSGQNSANVRHRHTCSWIVLILVLLIVDIRPAYSQNLQVIANPSVTANELSQLELRAIYISRIKHWEDGSEITVFVMPQHSPAHQKFSKGVLRTLPHQLQAIWNRMFYSGMGRPPIEVLNEEEMINRVSRTPGAIGYTGTPIDVSKVQVIKVETLL